MSAIAEAQFEGPLEDRILIRELYGVYSDATMRQDRETYLACWSEDGVRIAPDGELHGKTEIARYWDGIWSFVERMGFFTEIGSIRVSGRSATARIYCREIVGLRTGGLWKVVGRYDDVLARQADRWVFARREYRLLVNEADDRSDRSQ